MGIHFDRTIKLFKPELGLSVLDDVASSVTYLGNITTNVFSPLFVMVHPIIDALPAAAIDALRGAKSNLTHAYRWIPSTTPIV